MSETLICVAASAKKIIIIVEITFGVCLKKILFRYTRLHHFLPHWRAANRMPVVYKGCAEKQKDTDNACSSI